MCSNSDRIFFTFFYANFFSSFLTTTTAIPQFAAIERGALNTPDFRIFFSEYLYFFLHRYGVSSVENSSLTLYKSKIFKMTNMQVKPMLL